MHAVIDDHSRVAYAEIHPDETAATGTAVLRRSVAWFADLGVTGERVLSDNRSAYRSHAWRDTCTELGIAPTNRRDRAAVRRLTRMDRLSAQGQSGSAPLRSGRSASADR